MRGRLSFLRIPQSRPSVDLPKALPRAGESIFYSVIMFEFVFHIKTSFRFGKHHYTERKSEARINIWKLFVINFLFNRDTRRGEHSLYSAAEVAIDFEGFFIYCFCVVKQFEPAFRFGALFSCNLEFWEHICKALGILRLGDICEHAWRGFAKLKNGVGITADRFAK